MAAARGQWRWSGWGGWAGSVPATWISLETHADEEPDVKALEVVADRKVGKARITLLRRSGRAR